MFRVLFVRKHPQGRVVVILDPSKVSCLPIASTEIGSPSEGGVIELLHGRDVIIMGGREGACPRLGESIHAPGGGAFSEPSHIPLPPQHALNARKGPLQGMLPSEPRSK